MENLDAAKRVDSAWSKFESDPVEHYAEAVKEFTAIGDAGYPVAFYWLASIEARMGDMPKYYGNLAIAHYQGCLRATARLCMYCQKDKNLPDRDTVFNSTLKHLKDTRHAVYYRCRYAQLPLWQRILFWPLYAPFMGVLLFFYKISGRGHLIEF